MDFISDMGVVLPVAGLLLVLVLVGGIAVSRYKIAAPDEAIVVTGSSKKSGDGEIAGVQKVVQGGGVFVLPFIQQGHKISLASRQIAVRIEAISSSNIILNLEGVAIVKVGGSDPDVRAAAQRFLRQQGEIERFTQEVLAGSLRAIVGGMSVDEIIRDRAKFASDVTRESETSLSSQGLILDTFQIQGISDNGNYLTNLGRPEEAEVQRKASISEAEAKREADKADIEARQYVIDAQRILDLREAAIKEETDTAKAKAAAAGPAAEAEENRRVVRAEQELAEDQALLEERRLVASINKPADANLYQARQQAEANRVSRVTEAEASAESVRLAGDAELSRRTAAAKAVSAEGQAEADAISAKGEAEAKAMEKKAAAYAGYGQEAISDILISNLSEIVKAASDPISKIKDLTVVSTDGAGSLAKSSLGGVANVLNSTESLLGFSLKDTLKGLAGKAGNDEVSTKD